jgi:ribonuclease HI
MKMMTASLWSDLSGTVNANQPTKNETLRIEFDGGSTCNIPRLGYGQGYGSYRIGDGNVQRVKFGECMSANCAEILTLVAAMTEARKTGAKSFLIIGDSMIALKWANVAAGKRKATKIMKTSPGFQQAIVSLYQVASGIQIETKWQPREASLATFGH